MINVSEATKRLTDSVPSITVKDNVIYRDVYLFRVEFDSESEKNYDPFFSVNIETGEVKDFSVIVDGDIAEITMLFLNK